MSKKSEKSETKVKLDADVDALFRLPVAEFTGARNELAARLKKSGRGDDAVLVKELAKPSVSAWAVNQLYWNQREAFDELIAAGERFHKAQKSGKVADMRVALDARREGLTHLSDLATSLLRDAGHSPAPDTIHRITTTLEALSVYASRSDARNPEGPGRLTHDVDPPGFESLGAFVPSAGMTQPAKKTAPVTFSSQKSSKNTPRKVASEKDAEDTRKTKLAEARVSLQDAKRLLSQARTKAESLEAAQKKAGAEAKKTEKRVRDAEEELKKATAASEDAAERARNVADELEEATRSVSDAEREVEKATKELEALFRT